VPPSRLARHPGPWLAAAALVAAVAVLGSSPAAMAAVPTRVGAKPSGPVPCNDGSTGTSKDPIHYTGDLASLNQHPVPAWWTNAKFGIFIHWGPYSVPAYAPPGQPFIGYAEWYWFYQQIPGTPTYQHHLTTYGPNFVYDDFIPQFKAQHFDPKAWISLIKQSGAKYFVLTAKHHDGFALWPTKTTNRNSVQMGPHRDLVGALLAAACGSGIKSGLYYSIPEFFNPAPQPKLPAVNLGDVPFTLTQPAHNAYTGAPTPYTGYKPISDYATGQVTPQVEELIHQYHPSIIWCDIGGNEQYFQSNQWIADYYNDTKTADPSGVVVDDRCGDQTTHSDYNTIEYGQGTPAPGKPNEVIRGLGFSFGYNAQEKDSDYLSVSGVVQLLADTVARNGNLLLDIGPKADGIIPAVMVNRLQGVGAWLKINGAAIYNTHPFSQPADGNVRFTVGANGAVYAIALGWPGNELRLNAPIPIAGKKVVLLGSNGKPLPVRQDGSAIVITTGAAHASQVTTSKDAFVFRIS
jgi:alpha-L-fucosidase